MPFVDALPAAPRRIVSLVPSQTELLAALGLDAEVVGLTRFCVHPAGWKARKAIVGGTKDTDPDRVLALAPDLVLANREENDRGPVEAIARAAPVHVTDPATVAASVAMVRGVGRLVHRRERADALADEIAAAFDALPAFAPVRALYLIWRDPWMTVGGDTVISDVMAHAGLANVCADRTRYPALAPDEVAALAPEVVLLSSEPYPFADEHVAEVAALAPAARVLLVDGEPFSWYGPRLRHTPAALREVRARLAGR